jgi:hypothetical protein
MRHECLASLLGDRDKSREKGAFEEKSFFTGLTRAAKAGRKSLVPAQRAQQTN